MWAVIVNSVRITLDFEPDIVVYHPKVLSAPMVADRLGIPHVVVELVPAVTPTSAFPAPGTVAANLGPLNRLTYSAARASARMFSTELSEARALVGITSRRDSPPALSLMPISPEILARPADWPGTVKLTGAWFSDAAPKKSDAEWESFAAAGEYVYAGFGSMATSDPIARGRAIVVAARAQGMRLVVATGLGGIAIPPELEGEDVLIRDSVDHGTARFWRVRSPQFIMEASELCTPLLGRERCRLWCRSSRTSHSGARNCIARGWHLHPSRRGRSRRVTWRAPLPRLRTATMRFRESPGRWSARMDSRSRWTRSNGPRNEL